MKMKAETDNEAVAEKQPAPIMGDVIGDTAYSERFVLKILLELANQYTLKEKLKEPYFLEELCTLWDMTAERDVVLYLQTHDTLNLFKFAIPMMECTRIIEIVIGIIGNMCCHKEVVNALITNKDLLMLLLEFLKSDDCQILNQLLRLIYSCVFEADDNAICTWMEVFEEVKYPESLNFILKNSSNKELLMTALENLNTVCLYCKTERTDIIFNNIFVVPDTPVAVHTAHCEYRNLASPDEKLERLHIITLQMMLHVTKLEDTDMIDPLDNTRVFVIQDSSQSAIKLLQDILVSYEDRMIEYYKIDFDFLDVLDAATIFIRFLNISSICTQDKFFTPSYNMWKALTPNGREKKSDVLKQFMDEIKVSLCGILCTYLSQCTDENLSKVLDDVGEDYETIVSQVTDADLQAVIANRALNYRNSLNENVNS